MALMLYLSMVLIGRRHWRGGHEGRGVAMHYFVRFLALLAVVVVSIDVFLLATTAAGRHHAARASARCRPQTRQLLRELESQVADPDLRLRQQRTCPKTTSRPSSTCSPRSSELKAAAGDKLDVDVRTIDPFSAEATQAEQQFGIRPQPVEGRVARRPHAGRHFPGRGGHLRAGQGGGPVLRPRHCRSNTSGAFDRHRQPAEAEEGRRADDRRQAVRRLRHAIDVAAPATKLIIDELQKQYDVVQVDPTNPITDQYDVLLAVQPSSLGPQQMENFIAAVEERPADRDFRRSRSRVMASDVPGTTAAKQPPGGMNAMMMGRQPPAPKGDIAPLWAVLGVDFDGGDVVWQDYNPYPQFRGHMPKEFVFVEEGASPRTPSTSRTPSRRDCRNCCSLSRARSEA